MKYVIVTVEWCLEHGIVIPPQARKSVDGLKVILHEGYVAPVLSGKEDITCFLYDSPELRGILSGPEWTVPEKEETP